MAKAPTGCELELAAIMKVAQRYARRANREFVCDAEKVRVFEAASGHFFVAPTFQVPTADEDRRLIA